jgi:hypothetical protein
VRHECRCLELGLVCGCRNCVTSCDLHIFVDQAAETVAPQDADTRTFRRRIGSLGGRVLVQRPVRPVGVVVIGVLIEEEPQVPLAGDQYLVQAFAAGAADPPLRDRVRTGRPDGRLDGGFGTPQGLAAAL